METNYYDVLGVDKGASPEEIKKQYKTLAQKYHPDRYDGTDAKTKFQEVNTAYQTLKDPQKRAEYDNPRPQGHEFSFRTGGGHGETLQDILSRAMGGGGFGQRQQQRPMAQVQITLEDAFTGTTRALNGNPFNIPAGVRSGNQLQVDEFIIVVQIVRHPKFQRSHDDLLAQVEITAIEAMLGVTCEMTNIDEKIVKIKIPAGIQHGQLVQAAGMGMPNPEFTSRGNLLVQVAVTIPKDLTKAEQDSIININQRKTFKAYGDNT